MITSARQIAARLKPLKPALSKEIERVLAAIPAIYSSGHTAKLGRANYTINIFLTDEEPHCLQFGSSITCAKNKTNKVRNIKYKYYGFRF